MAIAAPGLLPSSVYGNHEGARVTIATKAMLSNTDPLVGYTTVSSIPFMLHEKSPYQVDFDYTLLTLSQSSWMQWDMQVRSLLRTMLSLIKITMLALFQKGATRKSEIGV
ncbi:DUF2252 family protein [uncultured Nostoc sp.]|uniref:DUF2252 family protein n=1 Tax=uncultured Nostoc sp. TaxID=340711 RepID=UPI002625A640|nr:DUF2252 family protein [uncultured Nostoc sp.]